VHTDAAPRRQPVDEQLSESFHASGYSLALMLYSMWLAFNDWCSDGDDLYGVKPWCGSNYSGLVSWNYAAQEA
jgi:hypothetical protein